MDDHKTKVDDLKEGAVTRALDTLLGDREATTVTRVRLQAVLDALANDVAVSVSDMAHLGLVDTRQAAERLGITPRRVRALAASRGLGWQTARDWVFRAQEVDAMRERTPGRPPRARYTIETGPSWVEPPRTYTNRAVAKREARAVARDAGSTLDSVRVVDQDGTCWLWYRRNPEGDRWYRAETGS